MEDLKRYVAKLEGWLIYADRWLLREVDENGYGRIAIGTLLSALFLIWIMFRVYKCVTRCTRCFARKCSGCCSCCSSEVKKATVVEMEMGTVSMNTSSTYSPDQSGVYPMSNVTFKRYAEPNHYDVCHFDDNRAADHEMPQYETPRFNSKRTLKKVEDPIYDVPTYRSKTLKKSSKKPIATPKEDPIYDIPADFSKKVTKSTPESIYDVPRNRGVSHRCRAVEVEEEPIYENAIPLRTSAPIRDLPVTQEKKKFSLHDVPLETKAIMSGLHLGKPSAPAIKELADSIRPAVQKLQSIGPLREAPPPPLPSRRGK